MYKSNECAIDKGSNYSEKNTLMYIKSILCMIEKLFWKLVTVLFEYLAFREAIPFWNIYERGKLSTLIDFNVLFFIIYEELYGMFKTGS